MCWGSFWLLTCSFLINLTCQVALLSAAKLLLPWAAEFCVESGFSQVHQPKEHPQSITGENIVKWVFSCYGETSSSMWSELCSIRWEADKSMNGKGDDVWMRTFCVLNRERKCDSKSQNRIQNFSLLFPIIFPNIPHVMNILYACEKSAMLE